jgi:hypothetical protein
VLGIPKLTGIFKTMDLYVCLYVDDLIFTGNNPTMFEDFKKCMVQEFEMTNIGLMAHFLGLDVI